MKKQSLLVILFFSVLTPVAAQEMPLLTTEALKPATVEVTPMLTAEVTAISSPELSATVSGEVITGSGETTGIVTTETPLSTVPTQELNPAEGYKGLPWGADFSQFKQLKACPASAGGPTKKLVDSEDNDDVALLLGSPVYHKEGGGKYVNVDFVPARLWSVYLEKEDVYYIFVDGKFAMVFGKIMPKNYDKYLETLSKKYVKIKVVDKSYNPSDKVSYKLTAPLFAKGETSAYLIKIEIKTKGANKKKATTTIKTGFLLASTNSLSLISNEIESNWIQSRIREKQKAEQDLLKIE